MREICSIIIPAVLYTISPVPRTNQTSTGRGADQLSCIMRCRSTEGRALLNLRPQLWPCGKHLRHCTITTSKQTAEEGILTKWHLGKLCSSITVQPYQWLPQGSVGPRAKGAWYRRQLQMDIHHISTLRGRIWSPDCPLQSRCSLATLGHCVLLRPIYFNMGRTAANNRKRKREREAEREKGESILVSQGFWG